MSKARDILREHEMQADRDDWRQAKKRAIDAALPTLPDRKPVAESNVPGAHFVRNFVRLKS